MVRIVDIVWFGFLFHSCCLPSVKFSYKIVSSKLSPCCSLLLSCASAYVAFYFRTRPLEVIGHDGIARNVTMEPGYVKMCPT